MNELRIEEEIPLRHAFMSSKCFLSVLSTTCRILLFSEEPVLSSKVMPCWHSRRRNGMHDVWSRAFDVDHVESVLQKVYDVPS
jgi:hypothetical protein